MWYLDIFVALSSGLFICELLQAAVVLHCRGVLLCCVFCFFVSPTTHTVHQTYIEMIRVFFVQAGVYSQHLDYPTVEAAAAAAVDFDENRDAPAAVRRHRHWGRGRSWNGPTQCRSHWPQFEIGYSGSRSGSGRDEGRRWRGRRSRRGGGNEKNTKPLGQHADGCGQSFGRSLRE